MRNMVCCLYRQAEKASHIGFESLMESDRLARSSLISAIYTVPLLSITSNLNLHPAAD